MVEGLANRWNEVCTKWSINGFESLVSDEKLWIAVRGLIDSTNNGGIISFFYNSPADHLLDCFRGLQVLNANDAKNELLRACALFPGGVPATLEGRNIVINSWNEGQFDNTLDDIDRALVGLFPSLEEKLSLYISRNLC